MKERPILFSGPMVRTILKDEQTQTRRVIRNPARLDGLMLEGEEPDWCPYGGPGDRLWVRETWEYFGDDQDLFQENPEDVIYRATPPKGWLIPCWRPSIHMPRWASRITLEILSVRAERLQDISDEDCCAEMGCPAKWPGPGPEPYKRALRPCFRELWDGINAKRGYGWDANPWVWVLTFRRLEEP